MLCIAMLFFVLVGCSTDGNSSSDVATLREPKDGIRVHDDEFVTISYLGAEQDQYNNQSLVFHVINKTNADLAFQGDIFQMDGKDLGYARGSDSIEAQSEGTIRLGTQEEFPTLTPEKITGTLRVIDFSKTVFSDNKQSYNVSFTDLNVTS